MDAMALLDQTQHWHMSVYQLEVTMRPLMFLHPSIVSVVPCASCESSYIVWPVPRRRHARPLQAKTTKKKKTLDAVATVDADVDGMDNSSDANGVEEEEHGGPSDSGSEGGSDESEAESIAKTLEALMSTVGALDHLSVANVAFIADAASRADSAEPRLKMQEANDVVTSGHGGASSSTDPPPLEIASTGVVPPVAVPARVGATRGSKSAAAITVETPCGTIAYYEKGEFFEAVCKHAGHGQCKMRRSCKASARAKNPAGRPLGFLMCWLYSSDMHLTKEEHWDKDCWSWSQEDRSTHRAILSTLESGHEIQSFERDRLDDEDTEPEDISPYLRHVSTHGAMKKTNVPESPKLPMERGSGTKHSLGWGPDFKCNLPFCVLPTMCLPMDNIGTFMPASHTKIPFRDSPSHIMSPSLDLKASPMLGHCKPFTMVKAGTSKASQSSKRSSDAAEPKKKWAKLQPVGNCECLLCKCKSQSQLAVARRAKEANTPLDPSQVVQQQVLVGIEMEKSFHVASEKTLRQLSGLARLPKTALKKAPSFKVNGVASSTGEEETLFLFKDGSDDGIRKAKLKIFVGANHLTEHMGASNCFYGEQGEAVQAHVLNQSTACKTLLDNVNKDGNLFDVEQFVSEHLVKAPLADEEVDDKVVLAEEEIAELVGPGAAQHVTAPSSTTKAKTKQSLASPSILRLSSKTSMAGDASTAAASTYGGFGDGSIADGDMDDEDEAEGGGWNEKGTLLFCPTFYSTLLLKYLTKVPTSITNHFDQSTLPEIDCCIR
eukprot:2394970-Amphidinium_carterae.2